MFKSKLEVDRHVDNCLKKINNETERNLRCFSFAKLYFNVGDYEQARRYVSSYLSVKPRSAEGYHLLGKCLEKLEKKEAALEAYRNSLQIDSKQNNLVIKVCELLSSDDVDMDQSGARYFCDLAQTFDPNNPAVYSLKERLITKDSDNPVEVSQLLLKELESRPTDINLRVRLLKHFLQNNMIKEAYKHASAIEEKNLSIFHYNLSWYETFAEVLLRFQRDLAFSSQLTWEFWFLYVSVLDRLAALSLDDYSDNVKTCSEYIATVFNFDQMLWNASKNISSCSDRQLVSTFLDHYHAQLYFHIATLVFKQAKKDLIHFKEASNITLPVLFAAYHVQPPDLQSMWLTHSSEKTRKLVQHWHKAASFRCSQTGHILLASSRDRKSIVIDKANQYSTGMWREQLFKKVFVKRDQQLKMPSSFFASNTQPLDVLIKLPDSSDLLKHDEVAQLMYPDSLHHYIWTSLNSKLSGVELKSFEGLQLSVKNLSNCAAEALSLLDVQAFIYCATLCVRSKLNENKQLIFYNQDRPSVLPASITENLGTLDQSKFLKAAYKMYKNEPGSNMSDLRLLLIRGIEVIRCVGHHGLDVKLLVMLAQVFEERLKNLTKQSEIEFNSARADLYWKTALPMLEKIKNNQAITYSSSRLFEYRSKEMSIAEASAFIEKGKLFTATQLMKKKEYEKALQIFENLKDPYASFYQSQIYKHMADQKTNQNKENVTSEMRSQNIILLSRARDCLYLTLDRLREPSVDKNHPLNVQLGNEIEKIERLLSRIDPDCANRNECDGMSEENNSSDNSIGEQYLSTYTNHNSFQNGHTYTSKLESHHHSTPMRLGISRQEARPSPERLDAQIRQMVASRDAALNGILEQNKIIAESHKGMLDELRSFKEAVNNLTSMVDDLKTMKRGFEELKDIKKSVDELKHSVDDLQNVVDVVQEMKKEITELKKDNTKNNQLNDEDLFALDPEYGVDFNLGSNVGAFGSSVPNVYPNYPGARLPNPNPLAAYAPTALYPSLYPGLAYAYGGLGLPQPGTLPFVSDQQQMSQIPGMATPGAVGYPQILGQSPLNPTLTSSTGLGLNMVTGQPLSQGHQQHAASQLIKDISRATSSIPTPSISQNSFTTISSSSSMTATSRAPPVNVVITSSDPLPLIKTPTSQPVLSVTIPPQHIKGNTAKPPPQISQASSISLPSMLSSAPSVPTSFSSSSLFSGLPQNKTPAKNVGLGFQIGKSPQETFSSPKVEDTSNYSNVSSTSLDEHDPCPDFKPIIPLPDEVPVNTGEENETELFCQRAKLFRHFVNKDTKEWKERGVGNLKILHNKESGKIRILMRRDQIHKICANHFITKEMTLTPMANNERAYVWAAQDFADEEVVTETFCVRFKTAEEGKKFLEAFESAKKLLDKAPGTGKEIAGKADQKADDKTKESLKTSDKQKDNLIATEKPREDTPKAQVVKSATSQSGAILGGFVFTSTPTFKTTETTTPKTAEVPEKSKTSPFAAFTFGKSNTQTSTLFQSPLKTSGAPVFSPLVISQEKQVSENVTEDDSHAEDFVPTAEFKPVVALPDLVEVKTGEENSEILFESRAKLFRYDTSGETKEWKERGLGVIKVLKDDDSIRLLMRRDQVHKVCCNHKILKNMVFKVNPSNSKAIVWHAKDFSEGVLTPETFTVRFKTEELANQFLQTVQTAQTSLDENNKVSGKHHKPETRPRTTSFGDKFKPAKGSWECKNCYIVNEGKDSHCVACETPKSGTAAKKVEESGPVFSFGVGAKTQESKPTAGFLFGQKPATNSWGNDFKPAEGSWECKTCYIRNPADKTKCASCDSSKDGSTDASDKSTMKGVNLDTQGLKFNFGLPTKPEEIKPAVGGFGDAFKPKAGSWECKQCMVRNNPDVKYCSACDGPKDDTVPKKETKKGIDLSTPGQKFVFGMPSVSTPQVTFGSSLPQTEKSSAPQTTMTTTTTTTAQVTFGSSTIFGSNSTSIFKPPTSNTFTFKPATAPQLETKSSEDKSKFVFGSPQKHDFEFKPRSPRRVSAGQGDEESDSSYVDEEEDNIYFKPVIPLPDKVEVKTGEEEEEVLYCHRAKLFRFVSGEWKERGLGDIKILKRKDSGKLRVVMRREQVLKICLNHILTKDIEYLRKDEKSWLFHAADFSEGEIVHEQFCVRFKNPEIAQEFKKAVSDALEGAAGGDQVQKPTVVEQDSDDDLEVVFETQVTPEEEKEALKLGLPPKFFSYKQLPDCTCEQCKKDDEYLSELFTDKKKTFSFATAGVIKSSPINFGTPKMNMTPSSGESIFSTPQGGLFNFTPQAAPKDKEASKAVAETTPENLGKSDTLRELLLKPSALASSISTPKGSSATTTPTKPEESTTFKTFSFSLGQSNTTAASPSIFGQSVTTTSSTGLFSSTATSGLFSSTTSTNMFSTPTPSVFGSKSGGSLFGSGTSTSSVFGSGSATPVFGSVANSSTSIFGGVATATTSASIFGGSGSIFGGTTPSTTTTASIFGGGTSNVFSLAKTPVFGTTSTATNLFGGSATNTGFSLFGTKQESSSETTPNATTVKSTTGLKEDDEVILKCSSDISFASLAANTSADSKPAFSKTGNGTFAFLGAGAPVFGSADSKRKADTSKNHYEPIIPLPDDIVWTTGEENETILFNERAKLFRFDASTKEWKERGVGQMKVLHHPENNTYRLLLRREQAHKVVLNQLMIPSLELQPMLTSEKAWMWAGYNYTDEGSSLEQLAVRFKNMELAQQFRSVVEDVINKLTEAQNNSKSLPVSVQNYGIEDVSIDDQNTLYTAEEEYEDEDEDDGSVMFMKRCTLSELIQPGSWNQVTIGDLQVYYDPQLYAARISINDDSDNVVSNTLTGVNTIMDIEKNECTSGFEVPFLGNLFLIYEPVNSIFAVQLRIHFFRSVMFMKRCTLSELIQPGSWNEVTIGDLQVYYDPELYAARISINDDSGNVVSNTLIGVNTLMDIEKNECTWKAVEWAEGAITWRTLKASFSSVAAAQEFHSNYLEGLNYAQQVGIVDEIPFEHDAETED
nr:E3 SUMO-protein ligase RanBP2 [Leptinotarsa decemlineata]